MARPSKYTKELSNRICVGIMGGTGLRQICEAEGISVPTVFNWLRAYPEFFKHYAQAREVQAEVLADEIISISDETPTCQIPTKSGDVFTSIDKAGVERNRWRVDARKWAASKLLPKKFGDKVQTEVTGESGGPIVFKLEKIGNSVNKPGKNDSD